MERLITEVFFIALCIEIIVNITECAHAPNAKEFKIKCEAQQGKVYTGKCLYKPKEINIKTEG